MVSGLDLFRDHFTDHIDKYLIIGGTACDLNFTDAGLDFRATKDIDIVLCLEAVDADFARAFWEFVQAGEYASLEAPPEKRQFYRFNKPQVEGYPFMLELFSKVPEFLGKDIAGHLTPIPIDEEVSSLSAILLDSDYYEWTQAGRVTIDELPLVRAEHLIPLKAKAWLDLTERAAEGQRVDRRDIRKHKNDVFRLYAVAEPAYTNTPADSIRQDMEKFIGLMWNEEIDMKAVGLEGIAQDTVLDALTERYSEARR